jgi:hypothetical protein
MKTLLFIMSAITLSAATTDPLLRNDWHVLTKTRGGTVSMVRNLPLAEAVKVYGALDPWRGRPSNGMYYASAGDIDFREILGPAEWDGCHKAMKHQVDFKEAITDGGPNKGLRYKSGSCVHCNDHQFVWIDTPKQ